MNARILIACEIPTNRIALAASLAASGYRTLNARSSSEALAAAKQERPDAMILSGPFSDITALEICQALRAEDLTCNLPVIVLAETPEPGYRVQALCAGADEVLPRRCEPQTILVRIRNLMRTRTLANEVAQRQKTAADLGFNEAPAAFERAAQVLIVNDGSAPTNKAGASLNEIANCQVNQVSRSGLYDYLARTDTGPDMFLLCCGPNCDRASLSLVADLRSRSETRQAAIIVACPPDQMAGAVSALDLGANDLMANDSLPAEFLIRVATQLRQKRKADLLRDTVESGLHLAVTDPLTGLFNRRYALPHLARLLDNAAATKAPIAVMVLDLDRFKTINDEHGHAAGDAVLAEIAQRLKTNLRGMDLLARIGGEEFLVAMPDTDLGNAQIAAERLRRVTQDRPVVVDGLAETVAVTVSIGLAAAVPNDAPPLQAEMLIDRADRALLSAKSRGRNVVDCVRVAA